MRANASKLVLLLAGSVACAQAAYGSTPKPAPRKAAAAVKPSLAHEKSSHHAPERSPKAKPPAVNNTRPERPAHAKVAPREGARPAARVEPAPPPAQGVDQEMLGVRHDRKQHFSQEPDSPEAELPRKATAEDFLAPFSHDAAAKPAQAPAALDANLQQAKSAPAPPKPVAGRPVKVVVPAPAPALKVEPPVVVPIVYNKRGQLVVPPALKGSHEILVHQNEVADQEGLDRIQSDEDLQRLRERKQLVPIPVVTGLQSDERLPANRRYCRPWTAQFLATLAKAHYARFHTALQVNSAVRTVEVQERLLITNGNAAPTEGQTASPHLTGQAVDLAKHGLSLTEIAWLRGYLMPLIQAGKVDVEEEFQQACFHISVYRKYTPQPAPKREIAGTHRVGTALAAAIR